MLGVKFNRGFYPREGRFAVLILNPDFFDIVHLKSTCGSSNFWKACSEESPGLAIASRCTTRIKCIKPEKTCEGWFGANHSDQMFSFSIQELLPNLHNTFLLFLSILGICLHPSSSNYCSWGRTLFFSFVSSVFGNSLESSSHLLLGLPTCLRVLMLLSSPGMPVENSSGPPFLW